MSGSKLYSRQTYAEDPSTSGSTAEHSSAGSSVQEAFPSSNTSQGSSMEDDSSSYQLPRSIRGLRDAGERGPGGGTIVICLDGTGDKFDNDNSNIVHFVSCLKKDDRHQATYYQAGIGTYGKGGLSSGVDSAMDMAIGSGLGLHIRDAYHFLMHTYKEGDRICILGFSRGAYTARCVAGMVHKVGLLPPRNLAQIPFAYEFYKDETPEGWNQSAEFKKTFCINVNIYFVGVFDSVASVGFIPRQLPLSSTPTSKSFFFRHAMALDERRAKFKICRFQNKDASDTLSEEKRAALAERLAEHGIEEFDYSKEESPKYDDETEYERQLRHATSFDTDVLEVWFAGCHADVGGGAVPNDERHKLSQIPLRWMIRQCFECNTGIIFDSKSLAAVGLDVHTLWPKYRKLDVPKLGPPPSLIDRYQRGLPSLHHRSKKLVPIGDTHEGEGLYDLKIFGEHEDKNFKSGEWLPEQVEDFFDILSPMNDQLVMAKSWWVLELWPVGIKMQNPGSDDWHTVVGMNLGIYRGVEGNDPQVHWTVRHLMNEKGYKIGARIGRNESWRFVA